METFWETRSKVLVAGTIIVLLLGIILAYTLPAVTVADEDDYGDPTKVSVDLKDAVAELEFFFDKGWIYDIARLGVLISLASAVLFTVSQRNLQRLCMSAGCAAGLLFPIYVHSKLEGSDSLGSGLICFGIACAIVGIAPWFMGQSDTSTFSDSDASGHRENAIPSRWTS